MNHDQRLAPSDATAPLAQSGTEPADLASLRAASLSVSTLTPTPPHLPRKLTPSGKPALLRQINQQIILDTIRGHGSLSRAEVTRLTGISAPTVSKTVAQLLSNHLIEEGEETTTGGRPSKTLRMASREAQVIGIEVGVRQCRLASTGLDGMLLPNRQLCFETPATYAEFLKLLTGHVQQLADSVGVAVLALGVSVPGLLDHHNQRTLLSPNVHLMDDHTLGADLQARLGWPTTVIQELHALCEAERTCGLARELNHFAILDLTDGLGLAAVVHGKMLEGKSGLAGELGHITIDPRTDAKRCGCGNRGCLETVATDTAFVQAMAQRLGQPLTIEDLLTQSLIGEFTRTPELDHTLEFLAIGLTTVLHLFNPEVIFLYARLLDLHPSVLPQLLEKVRRRALQPALADCQIVRASATKVQGALARAIALATSSLA